MYALEAFRRSELGRSIGTVYRVAGAAQSELADVTLLVDPRVSSTRPDRASDKRRWRVEVSMLVIEDLGALPPGARTLEQPRARNGMGLAGRRFWVSGPAANDEGRADKTHSGPIASESQYTDRRFDRPEPHG